MSKESNIVCLEEIIEDVRRGISYKEEDIVQDSSKPMYFNMKTFRKEGGFNPNGIKHFNGKFQEKDFLKTNEIIVSNTDVTNDCDILGIPADLRGVSTDRCLFSHHVSAISVKSIVDKDFLYYSLLTGISRAYMREIGRGTTVQMLDVTALKKMPLWLPDNLKEQKKIAEILTSVDRVIELTSQEIDKLKDLRFSYVEANLNPVNQKWKVVPIANVLDKGKNSMRGGPFGSNLLKEEWTTSGIPYLGIDNIHKESFNSNFKRYVTEKKFNELKVYSVFEGDVVVTIMGTIGRSCVIPTGFKNLLSSKHLRSMTLDQSKYIPTLLCYQLNYSSWVWRQYRAGQQGGIMDAINNDVLKELKICCPPMNEQKKMNDFLVQLKHKIDLKTEYLNSITSLKKGLMNDLLTGKVRLKVYG